MLHSAVSDIVLHCLLRPVCPNILGAKLEKKVTLLKTGQIYKWLALFKIVSVSEFILCICKVQLEPLYNILQLLVDSKDPTHAQTSMGSRCPPYLPYIYKDVQSSSSALFT